MSRSGSIRPETSAVVVESSPSVAWDVAQLLAPGLQEETFLVAGGLLQPAAQRSRETIRATEVRDETGQATAGRHAGPHRRPGELTSWWVLDARGVREGLFPFPLPPIPMIKTYSHSHFFSIPLFPIPITIMNFSEISKAKKCIIRHIQNIKTYINRSRRHYVTFLLVIII